MKILNYGSLNLDYVYHVDHFVLPGETVSSEKMQINPGGKGLNQSIALARAGAPVYHAGCCGAGGRQLMALLKENGIDISCLYTTDEPQGNAFIQVIPSGENSIVVFPGSNHCITEEQVSRTLSQFGEGDYLLLQNEISLLPLIVEKACAKGMKILLNPSPYNAAINTLDFGKLDWLLVNEVETEQITGCQDTDAAWERIHASYPELSVLFTLGSDGSKAFRVNNAGIQMVCQNAFRSDAVDTTGAGDTYTGYFIGGLMRGLPLQESMRQASMASALSVRKPGAASSIPVMEEVLAALAGVYFDRERAEEFHAPNCMAIEPGEEIIQ